MKKWSMSSCRALLGFGFFFLPAFASAQGPTEIVSPVARIFIPDGFDDNDNAEVILQGTYPSTCYKVGKTSVTVNSAAKVVEIAATSYLYDGHADCSEVEVPFIQKVKLGVLEKGTYKIFLKGVTNVGGQLPILARHTEAPDDYHYAPVVSAMVTKDLESNRQVLILEGHYPFLKRGCMVLKEVRTHLAETNVLVVQPITAILEGEACNDVSRTRAFRLEKELDVPFERAGLVHVRVLNGDSVNQFVPGRQGKVIF